MIRYMVSSLCRHDVAILLLGNHITAMFMLMMAEKGEACHTTNGPPGPNAVPMDGLPGPCTVSTLGRGGTIYGT